MARRPPLRLFHYRSRRRPEETNFGDAISLPLVARITGRDVVWSEVEGADIVAIGSVLQRVTDRRWYRPLRLRFGPVAVWGTGFVRDGAAVSPRFLDILALRGPRTAARAPFAAGVPLGDPGIALPAVFAPKPDRACTWAIVPHVTDMDHPDVARLAAANPGARVISLRDAPEAVLSAIAGAEALVSSSLHGLVAADALGIPNWRIRLGDRIVGGDFKFLDYAGGVGRADIAARPVPADGRLSAFTQVAADFAFQAGIAVRAEALIRVLAARFG